MNVLLLVKQVAAPGFNTLNLLLFHNLVFAAQSDQDSPSILHRSCKWDRWSSTGPGQEGDAEGRGSGRSHLLDMLRGGNF